MGPGECSWGFAARGTVLRDIKTGQSWGLAATQKDISPIPALQAQEAGRAESPNS